LLDFLRPITTAEASEAVDWLADLPHGKQAAGRVTSFCWSQQPQSWRRPCLLGIVRWLQHRWLARPLWSDPCYPGLKNQTSNWWYCSQCWSD